MFNLVSKQTEYKQGPCQLEGQPQNPWSGRHPGQIDGVCCAFFEPTSLALVRASGLADLLQGSFECSGVGVLLLGNEAAVVQL